jgi:hypothetical protein
MKFLSVQVDEVLLWAHFSGIGLQMFGQCVMGRNFWVVHLGMSHWNLGRVLSQVLKEVEGWR